MLPLSSAGMKMHGIIVSEMLMEVCGTIEIITKKVTEKEIGVTRGTIRIG
ncbi:MAG: hypothetical protein FWC44_02245 [Methanomassiliicoccaceae archaeon]|nr:hypothetical protein [Methanomassiliicoccaceae archaeon]